MKLLKTHHFYNEMLFQKAFIFQSNAFYTKLLGFLLNSNSNDMYSNTESNDHFVYCGSFQVYYH